MTAGPRERLRLFVAVELPADLRQALAALQDQLRRRGLESLRWVRPEGIHLTLKFLGETPPEKLPAIQQALVQATKGVPPHRLALGSLGTFGSRRSPQVLWVGLEGDLAPLGRLQERLEETLGAAGFAKEERRFAPHLTLARVRRETARAVAPHIVEALGAVQAPPVEMEVRQVSLMQSTLGPGGAVYQRLAAFDLG